MVADTVTTIVAVAEVTAVVVEVTVMTTVEVVAVTMTVVAVIMIVVVITIAMIATKSLYVVFDRPGKVWERNPWIYSRFLKGLRTPHNKCKKCDGSCCVKQGPVYISLRMFSNMFSILEMNQEILQSLMNLLEPQVLQQMKVGML
mmetsp:Transcript_21686/g.26122  ORF Transcript_21686/g.26122 Transcript_21686/m.26122 type:complete len:145 (-) Transcript_21686:144-578(-)